MTERPALRVVTQDGEVLPACPDCAERDVQIRKIEGDLRGKRLRIAQLEQDRLARILDTKERPLVELLHACHKEATKRNGKTPSRRKELDLHERECATTCVRQLGLEKCLRAIVGQTWDPSWSKPRRNGTRECYNTFELCFRTTSHIDRFAERAPADWAPGAEQIAAIANVSTEWVRERL